MADVYPDISAALALVELAPEVQNLLRAQPLNPLCPLVVEPLPLRPNHHAKDDTSKVPG